MNPAFTLLIKLMVATSPDTRPRKPVVASKPLAVDVFISSATLSKLQLYSSSKVHIVSKSLIDLVNLSKYANEMGIKDEVMNYIEVFYE